MRPWHALPLLGLSLLSSGCALIEDGARNFCVGVSKPLETHRELARNRQWAESAWQTVGGANAGFHRSDDYAQGFKDGFAEFLYRGGDGEPPLVAPLHYRKIQYQTAEGYTAIQDWFAGYRHGATYARDSGARRFVVGPSGLAGEFNEARPINEPLPVPSAEEPIPLPPPRVQPLPEGMSALPGTLGSIPPSFDPEVPVNITTPERATFSQITQVRGPDLKSGLPSSDRGPDLKSGLPSPDRGPDLKSGLPSGYSGPNLKSGPEPTRTNIQPSPELPTARPRITGISVAPTTTEPEPPRARITTITVTPPRE